MPERVAHTPDWTLTAKRHIFSWLYRATATAPGEWLAARLMAPVSPALALAEGERLVTRPQRVLALTAHPDDLEFFAGGVLHRMALAGSQITAVVLTDGEKRGNWTGLAARRQQEQEQAALLQGYRQVSFMGLPDFGLPEDPRLELLVARAWDQTDPEVLFAFDPKELLPGIANRDHKALGRTVMDLARQRIRQRAAVYFYGTHHPNVLVDITGVMDEKVRAATAHQSQMVYLDPEETAGAFRMMGRIAAGESGCQYAEPLYRLV